MSMTRRSLIKGAAGLAAASQLRILGRAQEPSSANVTVDLSSRTGKTLEKQLYGYATGALFNNDFALAADEAAKDSARILDAPIIRFNTPDSNVNANQTLIQAVFANGIQNPDWTPLAN